MKIKSLYHRALEVHLDAKTITLGPYETSEEMSSEPSEHVRELEKSRLVEVLASDAPTTSTTIDEDSEPATVG
jgi:hypothetical protein